MKFEERLNPDQLLKRINRHALEEHLIRQGKEYEDKEHHGCIVLLATAFIDRPPAFRQDILVTKDLMMRTMCIGSLGEDADRIRCDLFEAYTSTLKRDAHDMTHVPIQHSGNDPDPRLRFEGQCLVFSSVNADTGSEIAAAHIYVAAAGYGSQFNLSVCYSVGKGLGLLDPVAHIDRECLRMTWPTVMSAFQRDDALMAA